LRTRKSGAKPVSKFPPFQGEGAWYGLPLKGRE
jgi:hypothetical protein